MLLVIDIMTLTQILTEFYTFIPVIAIILTLFTSGIAYFTLREMQNQRKSSYQPDIILNLPDFYMYSFQHGTKHLPLLWTHNKQMDKENVKREKIFANGYNIGIGSAKQLKVVWNFNIVAFLQKIKAKNKDNILNINFSKNLMIVKLAEAKTLEIAAIKNTEDQIDYIIPSQIKSEPVKFNIPIIYLHLVSILIFLENFKEFNTNINFIPLKMNLSYRDIGNTEHKKEFTFYFKISSLGQNVFGDIDNIKINAEIKTKKIK